MGTIIPRTIVPLLVPIDHGFKGSHGGHLRRIRHEKNLTQEDLAEQAGLSMRYVGAIERGKVSASVTVLGRIADALGVDPCELLHSFKP